MCSKAKACLLFFVQIFLIPKYPSTSATLSKLPPFSAGEPALPKLICRRDFAGSLTTAVFWIVRMQFLPGFCVARDGGRAVAAAVASVEPFMWMTAIGEIGKGVYIALGFSLPFIGFVGWRKLSGAKVSACDEDADGELSRA